MGNRWGNAIVVLLWLGTMGWLVSSKVLPPLLLGDPPTYLSTLPAPGEPSPPPVGWAVFWKEHRIGEAVSTVERLEEDSEDGLIATESVVDFRDLPIKEMAPSWVRPFLIVVKNPGGLRVRSRMEFREGSLLGFTSTIQLGQASGRVKIQGTVDGSKVTLRVSLGEERPFVLNTDLPQNALVSDELSPRVRLSELRLGQHWTVPVYSPLRPRNPVEMLSAKVEREEPILWDGEQTMTWVVIHRDDTSEGLGRGREPRAILWVRHDGEVIKQVVMLPGGRLKFVRLNDEESQQLADTLMTGEPGR